MQIMDIMQTDIVTVTPHTSIAEAQRLLREHHIRHLPVVDGGSLAGLVSDRDLRDAFPSPATTLSKREILYQMDLLISKTCMARNVVTTSPDSDTVRAAGQFLDGVYGCLPVVDHGQLVGIVTEIDFLRSFMATAAPAGDLLPVHDYMRTQLYTVTSNTLVSTAHQRMLEGHIRHLPVVDEAGRLIGILTDRGIRQAHPSDHPYVAFYEEPELLQKLRVEDTMTAAVITVGEKTSVGEAGQILLDHRFGCLPVTRTDQVLIGMLTVTDLIRAYVAQHGELC